MTVSWNELWWSERNVRSAASLGGNRDARVGEVLGASLGDRHDQHGALRCPQQAIGGKHNAVRLAPLRARFSRSPHVLVSMALFSKRAKACSSRASLMVRVQAPTCRATKPEASTGVMTVNRSMWSLLTINIAVASNDRADRQERPQTT
jgi:hypothetical protein